MRRMLQLALKRIRARAPVQLRVIQPPAVSSTLSADQAMLMDDEVPSTTTDS